MRYIFERIITEDYEEDTWHQSLPNPRRWEATKAEEHSEEDERDSRASLGWVITSYMCLQQYSILSTYIQVLYCTLLRYSIFYYSILSLPSIYLTALVAVQICKW